MRWIPSPIYRRLERYSDSHQEKEKLLPKLLHLVPCSYLSLSVFSHFKRFAPLVGVTHKPGLNNSFHEVLTGEGTYQHSLSNPENIQVQNTLQTI